MFPAVGVGQVLPISFNTQEIRTPVVRHTYFIAQGSVIFNATFIFAQPQESPTVGVTPLGVQFSTDGTYDLTSNIQAQIADGVSVQVQGSLNGLMDILHGEGNATSTGQRIANLFALAFSVDTGAVTWQFNTPNAEDLSQGFWGSLDVILDGNRLMEMLLHGTTSNFQGLTTGYIEDERTHRRTWQLLRVNGNATARFRFGLTPAGVAAIGSRIAPLLPGLAIGATAVVLGVASMAILNACLAGVRERGERLGVLTRFCRGYVTRVYFPDNPTMWDSTERVFRQGVEGAERDIANDANNDAGIVARIASVTGIDPADVVRYNEDTGVSSVRDRQLLTNTIIRLAEAIQQGRVRIGER